ncbi:cell wall-binding repeat-containing protein [Slackia sp.]|uniref:cell wall-binding repeat-containing protein n=1 Tax=Slackia sp. TaxID=2049041 RepID=UPI002E7745ED|nr:cell wall-binding repeat-containing protein [Slackia sp.]MEE0519384.1 cell wall-binding repeat-containing protein [Slackia sp.]
MNISIRHGFKNAMVGLLAALALCCAPCAAAYADEAGDLSIGTFSLNNAGEKADVLAEYEEGLASADPLMAHMERMSDAVIVEGDKGLLSFLVTHKASEEKYVVRVYNAHGDLVAGTEGGFGGQSGMLPADYVKISVDTSKLNLSCGEYSAKCWIEHRASEADSWTKAPVTEVSFRVVENVCNGSHDFALESASEGTTCSNEGWLLDRCTRCEKDQWRWGFGDHVWDAGTVTKEPVSGSPGEKTITCTLCGQTKTEPFRNATVARIAGESASETSAAISSAAFTSSEWVVLARNDDFADAMSATGLAGALECPIILTDRNGLSAAAASEIQRLGATRAYVIGGRGAMPGNFEAQLSHVGCTLERRVFGDYAYDTSVECAKLIAQHGDGADAIVAMGTNFQDALSISSFAYKYKVPIFLQTQGSNPSLPQRAVDYITKAGGKIYVPGGPGAVPEASVEGVFGEDRVVRMYGEDGYDTSNQIAHYMVDHKLLSVNTAVVACGAQAAKGSDALSGAALAGKNGGVVLLVNGNTAVESQHLETIEGGDSLQDASFLSLHRYDIDTCYMLGGAYVMPDAVLSKTADIIMATLL